MIKDIFESMLMSEDIKINNRNPSTMFPREVSAFKEEMAKIVDRPRIRTMDKIYDLFQPDNILPYPDVDGILEKEMQDGTLYSLSIKEFEKQFSKNNSATRFDFLSFLNITRNGKRFTVPMYKLFFIKDNTLMLRIVSTDTSLEIDIEPDDQIIIVKGDTFMTVVKQIRKQASFRKNIQQEHAGNAGAFNEDKL